MIARKDPPKPSWLIWVAIDFAMAGVRYLWTGSTSDGEVRGLAKVRIFTMELALTLMMVIIAATGLYWAAHLLIDPTPVFEAAKSAASAVADGTAALWDAFPVRARI